MFPKALTVLVFRAKMKMKLATDLDSTKGVATEAADIHVWNQSMWIAISLQWDSTMPADSA